MQSYGRTDVGIVRSANQDYIYTNDNKVGPLPNLYIVADGMGGHKAGDYSSRFCVEEFLKKAKEGRYKTLLGGLESIIGSVNEQVYEEAKKDVQ